MSNNIGNIVYKLEKNNFHITSGNRLRLVHPVFYGKNAFILFDILGCPECQDAKVEWTARAVLTSMPNFATPDFNFESVRAHSCAIRNFLGQQDYPSAKYIRKDGIIVDYRGPMTWENLSNYIRPAGNFY